MELEPTSPSPENEESIPDAFHLSSKPVVVRHDVEVNVVDSPELPRSYGPPMLCLMARDPRTLFAYWDIDWPAAFRDDSPKQQSVYLRILDPAGVELSATEVEPMAGNCYLAVPDADAAYQGEMGYFEPAETWNRLATSDIVTTPASAVADGEEPDFATVPFHLSFQHMVDLLRISKRENESLTNMLADLRSRAADKEAETKLTAEEHDLARVIESAAARSPRQPPASANDFWTQQRIEQILGLGTSSPSNAFGGSS